MNPADGVSANPSFVLSFELWNQLGSTQFTPRFCLPRAPPTGPQLPSPTLPAQNFTMTDTIERDRGPRQGLPSVQLRSRQVASRRNVSDRKRALLLLLAHALVFLHFLLLPQGVRAASYRPDSREAYERDKDTHRAVRAESTYNLIAARHTFTSQAFPQGVRTEAQVFSNFEDWRIGTHGWTLNGNHDSSATTPGAHFNSFSYPLLPALVARSGTSLKFDTDAETVVNNGETQNGNAAVVSDAAATKVVVFNVSRPCCYWV